ncbi:mast cell protease 1A-like [Pelodiscus sinensis]|uniref:mast cell protease 1A-like n=1 Tax=Pelodiscus sinensis TaxID=13735 RepID=UPI003F6BC9CB
MQVHILFLLPMAFLLLPGTQAGEIIGGHEAEPHSRPYMVCLKKQIRDKICSCGGFLVAENFVLTAAHCQGRNITVVLGAHNIRQREPSQQVIPVRRQIPHPQYNRETINNDIMLLQLKKKARLTKAVQLVPLPEEDEEVMPEDVCNVAGWGNTRARGFELPSKLQEVNLKVVEAERCWRYLNFIPTTMLCVGDPREVKKSTFRGDSGGPLVCDGTAQGIVSYGKNDGSPPRVFTSVSAYVPWIKANIRKHQD